MSHQPLRSAAVGRGRRRRGAVVAVAVLSILVAVGAGCSREPDRSVDAFCDQIQVVAGIDEVLASGDVGRIDEQLVDLRELEKVAPEEIQPKIAVLTGVTDELAHAIGTAPVRRQAAQEWFEANRTRVDEVTDAGQAVQDYTRNTCQISLSDTVPGSTPAATNRGTAATSTTSTKAATTTTRPTGR